jgi:3-oxoadipate enol-lactonase
VNALPYPPEPPVELPPARTLVAPGRGELFLRDTGGDGPVVMLLHGWIATADLNWWCTYEALTGAGYRVLAIDHRGHGRGLRPLTPFRLVDCAADAAAALRELDAAPALVVGYSMGGAIAQLVARDHPDVVAGLVLSGTWAYLNEVQTRRYWQTMGVLRSALSANSLRFWRWGFRRVGLPESERTVWLLSELLRHSARDVAEAGRELSRFDSRPWLRSLEIPTAMVLTTRDTVVLPRRQSELADLVGARVFEAPIEHLEVASRPDLYNPPLLEALAAVRTGEPAAA